MNKKAKSPKGYAEETPEISRIINVKDIVSSSAPVEMSISASHDELAALAKRFDLQDISSLSAHVRLTPTSTPTKDSDTSPDILAVVNFKANLTQTCSVSLDPVDDEITASISQIFSHSRYSGDIDESEDPEDEGEFIEISDMEAANDAMTEPPEPIINGKIDIGEFIAEELAIRINPFPRKKGVEFEWVSKNSIESDAPSGPFAALATLKDGARSEKKPKK